MLSTVTTDSTTYSFTYDEWGNQSSVAIGTSTLASYEYNDVTGTLKKLTYGNGTVVDYTYNELDMLTRVTFTGSNGTETVAYEYEYTAKGQVHKLIDHMSGTETVYTYDAGGRLLTVVRYDADEQIHDFSKKVSYDNEGKVTAVLRSMTYLRGTTEEYFTHQNVYNYNPDGSLRSEIIASGDIVTVNYEYDAFDRLVEKSANNGITTSYEYREFGTNQTDLLVTGYTNTINGVDSTYTYEYDSNGNITKITHGISVITYTYDDLGQLESEVYRTINDSFTGTSVYYLYDKAGNLKLIKTYTDTPEGSFLASEKDYTYTDSEWGDLLTRFNGTYIHYDDMGNPSNYYGNRTFVWTGRLMTKAFLRGVNQLITFTYDDDGVRTSKNRAGVVTNYYYDGTMLIAEETNGAITVYLYDSTGSPVGMQYRDSSYAYNSWDVYWFAKNLQGDVVAVYSDTGTLLVEYEYDSWGEFTVTYYNNGANTSAVNNNLRYRGYYYDSDIQLYYLISRYYDSNTGRFISPDSIVAGANGRLDGFNLYAYCFNNPVTYTDPVGQWPEWMEKVGKWSKNTYENAKKTVEILFTEEFIDNADDIFFSNVAAEAGVSIGFAVECSNSVASFEFSERIDILTIRLNDGKIQAGHAGRSALTIGVKPFTIGPQNDTFEYIDEIKDDKSSSFFDISSALLLPGIPTTSR